MSSVRVAKSVRLDALQGLRAIAAAMVVFVHGLDTYYDKVSADIQVPLDIELGSLGVKLFFCISGFIICSSARSLSPGGLSAAKFMRKRLLRIVPIYWIATLIYAVKLALQGQAPTLTHLILSLFFIPYANEVGMMRPVLGLGWSLNYEMLFYLVFALALFLTATARYLVLAVALGFLMICRIAGWLQPSELFAVNSIYLLSDSYLLYFLAGTGVALLQTGLLARTSARWSVPVALICVSSILIIYALLLKTGWIERPETLLWELPLCILCVSFCVMPPPDDPDASSQGVMRRTVVLAGDGSYSTYLTHGFVMGPLARLVSLLDIAIHPLVFASITIVLCTAVGVIVFKLVEAPLLRKMNVAWDRSVAGTARLAR